MAALSTPPDTVGDDTCVPIYDYHCDACGHSFSQVQSYTDATLDSCPQCGAMPRKLMSRPAIVFKGSGWYKTDSRLASSSSDGAKAASAETKADAKSAEAKTSDAKTSEAKTSDAKAPGKASTTAGEAAS